LHSCRLLRFNGSRVQQFKRSKETSIDQRAWLSTLPGALRRCVNANGVGSMASLAEKR